MKNLFKHKYLFAIILTLALVACSTEKNTFVNRNYHQLTAHYNVYFNGNEAMRLSLLRVENELKDDYTKILPIFKESRPDAGSMMSADMDISVDKGKKLIKLHSITKPPKRKKGRSRKKRKTVKDEYNKWVDDGYIMIGKAYYYKRDYIRASSTFLQIIRKYKKDPVKYDAYLWLARTYIDSERLSQARDLLETLNGDNLFPEELSGELAIINADMYMRFNEYDDAIRYLDIGIKNIKGNKRKTRYTYILAQLYQEAGNDTKALQTYRQVIRRRPNYAMMFNARINSAKVFSGEGNITELRKELNKMRRRKKNQTYLDQIYYALGNISYGEGDIDNATDLYILSAQSSIENIYQRALSCITLGDIYFDQKEYVTSESYYDSAMVLIDENYPNYESIENQFNNLNDLVDNIQAVTINDSLQYLASLTESERNALIEVFIDREKLKAESLTTESAIGGGGRGSNYRMRPKGGSSGWYFYNPSTVAYGKKEFQREWGERKLEDNWRRRNKSSADINEMGELVEEDLAEEMEQIEKVRVNDPTTRDFYMQDIPLNDSMMIASHQAIRDGLYNAALLLKNEFNDYENSIEYFKELNKRYPENMYLLYSYFSLFDLYKNIEESDSSEYYKNLIIRDYPKSNYAKYLINPNFFVEMEAQKDSINKLYNLAFTSYKYRQFDNAKRYADLTLKMNPDTTVISKVKFIRMISSSRNLDKKRFADSLRTYIAEFPNDSTKVLATNILALIDEKKLDNYQELVDEGYLSKIIQNKELLPQFDKTLPQNIESKWDEDDDLLHYFVIAIPNDQSIDVNRLKFDIANYNIDHYTKRDFDIETENLNAETNFILVRSFENKENALIYFLSIIRKPEVFKTLAGHQFINFTVSNNNFREMLSDKAYEPYLKFFVSNYSEYTTGQFDESELESPEELIARLAEERKDKLIEQGEYIEVEISDSLYEASLKNRVYKLDYDEAHAYVVYVKEKGFRSGLLMRNFIQYNVRNHRNKRLRAIPMNLKDGTAIMISQFNHAYEAQEYFNIIKEEPELLKGIKDIKYDQFVISLSNLNEFKKAENEDQYAKFYQRYYVKRQIPNPDAVVEPEPVIEEEAVTEDKSKEEQDQDSINVEKPVQQNDELLADTSNTANQEQPTIASEPAYTGAFNFDENASHSMIYIVPNQGYNSGLLIVYLRRFNAINFRTTILQLETVPLNDVSNMITVNGLTNKEKAMEYIAKAKDDQRLNVALRNASYKAYVISTENFNILKENKDLKEYIKFYNLFYNK